MRRPCGHNLAIVSHQVNDLIIPTARLTLLQEATESSKLGKTKTTKNRKKKTSRKPLLLFLIKLML
jgi:hypothetical protein